MAIHYIGKIFDNGQIQVHNPELLFILESVSLVNFEYIFSMYSSTFYACITDFGNKKYIFAARNFLLVHFKCDTSAVGCIFYGIG